MTKFFGVIIFFLLQGVTCFATEYFLYIKKSELQELFPGCNIEGVSIKACFVPMPRKMNLSGSSLTWQLQVYLDISGHDLVVKWRDLYAAVGKFLPRRTLVYAGLASISALLLCFFRHEIPYGLYASCAFGMLASYYTGALAWKIGRADCAEDALCNEFRRKNFVNTSPSNWCLGRVSISRDKAFRLLRYTMAPGNDQGDLIVVSVHSKSFEEYRKNAVILR